MANYIVAIYEIDLAPGGPEEGGWYYETGEHARTIKVLKSEDEALQVAKRANRLLQVLQKTKAEVTSVLYSGGRHQANVYKNFAPKFYPDRKPNYS